jgi:hypothetical protein
MEDKGLNILKLTNSVADLTVIGIFTHIVPCYLLVVANAIAHQARLINANENLQANIGVRCIW